MSLFPVGAVLMSLAVVIASIWMIVEAYIEHGWRGGLGATV